MRSRRLVVAALGCSALALAVAACQKPAPAAAVQPKRKSFEDSGSWQPVQSAPAAAPVGGSNGAGTTPQNIQQSWQQAHDAQGDAAKMQAANDALNKTQALADQSNASTPH